MADAKNARLNDLSLVPDTSNLHVPPHDPPPPYSEYTNSTVNPSSSSISTSPIISSPSSSSSSSSHNHPPPRSPDPNLTLLSSKRAHPLHSNSYSSSSSSHSIPPAPRSPSDPRRILLLVYIHGFYGNDHSFRAFPSHIHHHLCSSDSLSRTHLVHSKVYPRYKTYKSIHVARDNFSAWLQPHESPATDVVLLGHSMGGLLAAEIVLKPSQLLSSSPFQHRILGSVCLDAPFLGLHPGIVASGISSLFRPAPQSDPSQIHDHDRDHEHHHDLVDAPGAVSSSASSVQDPNFDPPYFNDAPFRERSLLGRVVNFASKHSAEGLFHALGNHITDHLDFGGCLADYRGLIARYDRVRALEDVHPLSPGLSTPRVRFVNYYTLSSGRPKAAKSSPREIGQNPNGSALVHTEVQTQGQTEVQSDASTDAQNEDHTEVQTEEKSTTHTSTPSSSTPSLQTLDPAPIPDDVSILPPEPERTPAVDLHHCASESSSLLPQAQPPPPPPPPPPLLPSPNKPEPPDLSQYPDRESRKQAEREFARLEKAYARDLKNHEKTLRERKKLMDEQRTQADKRAEKDLKEERKKAEKHLKEERKKADRDSKQELKQAERDLREERKKAEKDLKEKRKQAEKDLKEERKKAHKDSRVELKQADKAIKDERKRIDKNTREDPKQATQAELSSRPLEQHELHHDDDHDHDHDHEQHQQPEPSTPRATTPKPPKLRKFCATPRKIGGALDPAWVDVYMRGTDEVGAHCGLFVRGAAHYDGFVADVAERIASWVEEAQKARRAAST